jgi:predicted alpha/beta hydrolase family esterase
MNKNILFIQGGGLTGFEADAKLVASLKTQLGDEYIIHYPRMLLDEALPDFGWLQQINNEIAAIDGDVILVGHSLGSSLLLKCVSENNIEKKITGIFLMSTPFWSGDEDWVQGLKLKADFAIKLSKDIPLFLYHCRDDKEVPFEHFMKYSQKLPWATVRKLETGDHQLNNNLSIVANDIRSLK